MCIPLVSFSSTLSGVLMSHGRAKFDSCAALNERFDLDECRFGKLGRNSALVWILSTSNEKSSLKGLGRLTG